MRWGWRSRRDLIDDARGFVELVAPTLCEACGRRVPSSRSICASCRMELLPCRVVSSGTSSSEMSCLSAFVYDGDVARRLMHRFKYGGARRLGRPMGRALGRAWRRGGWGRGAGLIVPVPIAPDRFRERGYNQALILALEMGSVLRWPVLELLKRVRSSPSQTGLSLADRKRNPKTVFAARASSPYLPVVLVDDVWTTGATLRACRDALADHGYRVLAGATVFRTPPGRNAPRP